MNLGGGPLGGDCLIHGRPGGPIGGGPRRIRGGLLRIGGLERPKAGGKTGAAVISWPSICPPSMCFMAFSASSGPENST